MSEEPNGDDPFMTSETARAQSQGAPAAVVARYDGTCWEGCGGQIIADLDNILPDGKGNWIHEDCDD